MSDLIISIILAAGVGTFVYTKMGKRLGFGNLKKLWIAVVVSSIAAFIVIYLSIILFIPKK